jgi:sigma-B regulation protein RsbU (phosphoserine phosphatase)
VRALIDDPDQALPLIEDIITKDNIIMGAAVAFEPGYYPQRGTHYMLYANLDTLNAVHRRCITDSVDYDYHHMAWYADARDSGHSVWSEPYYDKGCGDRLMTTYSIPLKDDDGRVYGVFTADVSLVELVREINSLRAFTDDYTFVLTGRGNYVAHSSWTDSDDRNIWSNATAGADDGLNAVRRRMTDGETGHEQLTIGEDDLLVCYAPLAIADWSIGYACPYSSILSSLNSFTISAEAALLVVVVILILAMRWTIRRQIQPVERLTEATYNISRGNFDSRLPEIKTNDEFRRLHDAFESMQTSLKQYIAELTEATKTKQRISSELSIAHDIQMSLIPEVSKDYEYPQLDISALLRPAKEIGGDMYDFIYRDGRFYFTIADASGKGVPASMVMAATRAHFRMACQFFSSPARIVAKLNDALAEDNDTNMFVTMFVGIINLADNSFSYCNAGHNPCVVADASGSRLMDVVPNLPLGVLPGFDYQAQSMELSPDTMLLLYTDGLTEAENTRHELLGEESVLSALADGYRCSVGDVVARLTARVEAFADGAEQSDDLTLLCLKLNRKLEIHNNLAELSALPAFVADVCSGLSLDADRMNMLNLALEEALANVVDYAYPDGTDGLATLTAEQRDGGILFTLVDSGVAFDPTAAADPDISLSLDDRPVGGLGIFLIRRIMADVSYRRNGAYNELTMMYRL